MISEEEARTLLRAAAATIDVERPTHISDVATSGKRSARTRTAPLIAAAAVVAIAVGGGFLVSQMRDDTRDPGVVDSPRESPSSADAASDPEDAAEAFTALALGDGSSAPWAERVSVFIGGQAVATLDPDTADTTEGWKICPRDSVEYEGRECPVSPLSTIEILVDDGGTPEYSEQVPSTVGCNQASRLPGWESSDVVLIRPDASRRDCFQDFMVALYLDSAMRISAVDFVLSGP